MPRRRFRGCGSQPGVSPVADGVGLLCLAHVTTKTKTLEHYRGPAGGGGALGGTMRGKVSGSRLATVVHRSTRFLCAGLLMFALLRWTRWLGPASRISRETNRRLCCGADWGWRRMWRCSIWRSGSRRRRMWRCTSPRRQSGRCCGRERGGIGAGATETRRRGGAGAGGVAVLFWPTLHASGGSLTGEVLGLTASVLWTHYGRQCRALGGAGAAGLSGRDRGAYDVAGGVLLLPFALLEATRQPPRWSPMLLAVQGYCIIAGGILAFALWNHALPALEDERGLFVQ